MDELKACPHCGNLNTLELTSCIELEECKNFEQCNAEPFVCVVCNVNKGGCGATGGYADSEEKAIEAWNRRTQPENKALTWIPASEKLPIEAIDVFVCDTNGNTDIAFVDDKGH